MLMMVGAAAVLAVAAFLGLLDQICREISLGNAVGVTDMRFAA